MPKARAFFFVCAGIFLLAAAYHLGAMTATAQGGTQVSFAEFGTFLTPDIVATSTGDLYYGDHDPNGALITGWRLASHIPVSGPVVSINGAGGGPGSYARAYDAAGNYFTSTDGGPWTHSGNVFSGPTPATRATWGALKSRYRPGATATPQDK